MGTMADFEKFRKNQEVNKMKKEKVDFLFICERPQRELKSLILLCEELRRRGYSAKYIWGGDKSHHYDVKVLISNTLLTKQEIYSGIFEIAGLAKKVVNLCWEQLCEADTVKKRYEKRTNSTATFNYMFWGNGDYTKVVGEYVSEEQYKHIVGPIHLDFLRPQFDDTFKKREEFLQQYNIDSKAKILLYVSSFGVINPSKETVEIQKRLFGEELYWENRQFELMSQNEILHWFERVLQQDEDIVIVYRTHPGFNEGKRIMQLSENKRFKCISEGFLQQWIKVVDGVMMLNSTSFAECCIMNKTTYVLRPYGILEPLECYFYENVVPISNYEQFISCVQNEEGQQSMAYEKVYDISDVPTYIRICDKLEKIYMGDAYNVKWCLGDKLYFVIRSLKKVINKMRTKGKTQTQLQYDWDGCIDEIGDMEETIRKLINS